jgi:hypothetical protein
MPDKPIHRRRMHEAPDNSEALTVSLSNYEGGCTWSHLALR